MANDFPYTLANSRLAEIFASIAAAGTPPKFNNEFLKSTLGYTSSNDRAIISVLRALGFISSGGEPTQRYNDFKGHDGGRALAAGLREGWAPLFMADQQIYKKPASEVQKRVASITGGNETSSSRIANTFSKLCEIADWSVGNQQAENDDQKGGEKDSAGGEEGGGDAGGGGASKDSSGAGGLKLYQDIHIHLPATSDPAVYRAVFQAIKSELS